MHLLLVAGFLTLAARDAAAIDPRLAQRLDHATAESVGALIDSAAAAGIPTEPLVQRALQGALKKAPGQRIVAAVSNYAADLRTARDAVGAKSSDAEIVAGAAAIHAGVSSDGLHTLRAHSAGNITVALAVLTDLMANGVPAGNAIQAIQSALEKRATDSDLTTLRSNVAGDIKAGASPPVAAAARARGIAGRPPAPGASPAAARSNRPETPPGQSHGKKR